MSTAARTQLVLGLVAAVAAYLLLVAYNGGRIELGGLGLRERLDGRAVEAPAAQSSVAPQSRE